MTSPATLLKRAEQLTADVQVAVRRAAGAYEAVVLESPAGGGKSTFIAKTTAALARRHTVAVAASTNEQVYGLVRAISRVLRSGKVHHIHAEGRALPGEAPKNVLVDQDARKAADSRILVGTLNKIGDALSRGYLGERDFLIVDEAYQADSAKYYVAAPIASAHLLVGDAGQIDPFATTPEALRYRGLREDPVRTAVDVLLENRPHTDVFRLPLTRRLDARALPLARSFYSAAHYFDAVVPVGVRGMEFGAEPRFKTAAKRRLLGVLQETAAAGLCHLELPAAPALPNDPAIVAVIADLIELTLEPRVSISVTCERHRRGRTLTGTHVAVGASHREQVRAIKRELRVRGISGVMVDTANKLQGLEYELLIGWHPLAGLSEPDAFHLESGRLCVLATRHRQACILVGRESDRELLEGIPPSGEAWLGRADEPLLEGWDTHRAVFAALEPHRTEWVHGAP
jgi:AAA domain